MTSDYLGGSYPPFYRQTLDEHATPFSVSDRCNAASALIPLGEVVFCYTMFFEDKYHFSAGTTPKIPVSMLSVDTYYISASYYFFPIQKCATLDIRYSAVLKYPDVLQE